MLREAVRMLSCGQTPGAKPRETAAARPGTREPARQSTTESN